MYSIKDFHVGDYVRIVDEITSDITEEAMELSGKVVKIRCLSCDEEDEYPIGVGETWFRVDEIAAIIDDDSGVEMEAPNEELFASIIGGMFVG